MLLHFYYNNDIYRVSQKSSPPMTFNNIFAWVESFCIEFCTLIGTLYPRMYTYFHLFSSHLMKWR